MAAPGPVDKLAACFAKLPGVGRRSAERMAVAVARDKGELVTDMAAALRAVRDGVRVCALCGNLTLREHDPCRLCTASGRDDKVLCVVEDPGDIATLEKAGAFNGRYHSLMGKLSPMRGEGPATIRLQSLLRRLKEGRVEEVILALNTDVESDATASYLTEYIRPMGVRVTRLGFGLPVGSGIAYSDATTLSRALKGRQEA